MCAPSRSSRCPTWATERIASHSVAGVWPGLGDQAQCPLPELLRLPDASICHDSILLKDWSLRTRRGGSDRGRPELLRRAQPPDTPPAGDQTGAGDVVGEAPVAALRVIAVGVHQVVGGVGVGEVAPTDRAGLPLVEGSRGEAENPAGHRDEDLPGGERLDQRAGRCGRLPAAK
jgi:hypothetical protein